MAIDEEDDRVFLVLVGLNLVSFHAREHHQLLKVVCIHPSISTTFLPILSAIKEFIKVHVPLLLLALLILLT
jgi:hypothetical protein